MILLTAAEPLASRLFACAQRCQHSVRSQGLRPRRSPASAGSRDDRSEAVQRRRLTVRLRYALRYALQVRQRLHRAQLQRRGGYKTLNGPLLRRLAALPVANASQRARLEGYLLRSLRGHLTHPRCTHT